MYSNDQSWIPSIMSFPWWIGMTEVDTVSSWEITIY